MMRIYLYVCLFLVISALSCGDNQEPTPQLPSEFKMELDIMTLVNAHRKTLGLDTLVVNEVVKREAQKHCQQMADGLVPYGNEGLLSRIQRIKEKMIVTEYAENVSVGQPTAAEVIQTWKNGDSTRVSLEKDFHFAGSSVRRSDSGDYYYVLLMVKN